MRSRLAVLTLALCAVAACEAQTGQGALLGTIVGKVKRGPIMPVCRVDVPCDGVFAGAKIVVRGAGGVAGRAVSDEGGAFSVQVPAGTYTVDVEVEGMLPRCQSVTASVVAGQPVAVEIDCDTGIR